MEQMTLNNTFNTRAARGFLDDVKTRIEQLQRIVKNKTNLSINNWNSSLLKIKPIFLLTIGIQAFIMK